jgi:hypothetical protein
MANQPVFLVDYSMFSECPSSAYAYLAGYLASLRATEQILSFHP